MPALEIDDSNNVYTDHSKIHLSTGRIEGDSKEEIFSILYYFLGHELQHIRSTTTRDWTACLNMCERELCQIIGKRSLGKTIRIVKESDFENFYKELQSNGIYISREALQDFIHFVMNALEDGRIENISDRRHPGFARYRRLYRGTLWKKEELVESGCSSISTISDRERLCHILNGILTLSTTELYQKGFLRIYGGTSLHKKLASYIPYIRKAIKAKTCRECMEEAHKIVLDLADLIIESAKANEFETMMLKLISAMVESMDSEYNDDINTEDEGDGEMAEAPFGKSSLRDDDGKEESDKGKTKDEKEEKDDKEDSKGESKKESKEDSKDGSKGESKEESDGSKEHSDKKQSQDDTTEPDVNKNSSADDFEGDVDEIIDKIMEDALENPSPELDVAEDTEKKEKAFKDKMSKWES
jgi:hypothetical protein